MLDDYLNEILSICASEFDVTVGEARSHSKRQELVYCRKAFCVVVKELYDVKLETMAKKLDKSLNSVSWLISQQPDNKYYKGCLRRIREKVKPFME